MFVGKVASALLASLVAANDVSVVCRTDMRLAGYWAAGVPANEARLSWSISGAVRGAAQSGSEVEVSTSDSLVAWSSAKVGGESQMVMVPSGILKPGASYSWRSRVWLSGTSEPSAWCEATFFDTAPSADIYPGSALWIGGGGQLRASLELPNGAAVARARAYITGLGAFYLFVNGQRVGDHFMDPPQSAYSKRVFYETFDIASLLAPGQNDFAALLGNYKWGYNDIFCNMTAAGPDGCRMLLFRAVVELEDGSQHVLETGPGDWQVRQGPVIWDHFFHGETYDARVPLFGEEGWLSAVEVFPEATASNGHAVYDANGELVAIGALIPAKAPPLRAVREIEAVSVTGVQSWDVGHAHVYDFGQIIAGIVRLSLPAGHGLPVGTQLRIAHAEIVQSPPTDRDGMCELCPTCWSCLQQVRCDAVGDGAICNTYCGPICVTCGLEIETEELVSDVSVMRDLRHEPCSPHQSVGPPGSEPHWTPDRYIGDFNDANMTNIYIVGSDEAIEYTPWFAAAGFRFAQVSGLPEGFKPAKAMLTALKINSDVPPVSDLKMPTVTAHGAGTPDILNKIHAMTLESQTSNLFSIPTDCPQRERRGWLGDAQTTADEAMLNFDMQRFHENYLDLLRDDQERLAGNHKDDAGFLSEVVPHDGVGRAPGCPNWQIAYVVLARQLWKHHGEDALPVIARHWVGMNELMGWFAKHAEADGLLIMPCHGDWMGFNPESQNAGGSAMTPSILNSAFNHLLGMKYMSQMATALGKIDEAAEWSTQYATGKQAFHARFYSDAVGGYAPCIDNVGFLKDYSCHGTSAHGSQTSNALALAIGAAPDAQTEDRVAQSIVRDIENFGNRTTSGIEGVAFLFHVLDSLGYDGHGLEVLIGDEYPSIGHMARHGMTTLCENLACTSQEPGSGSQNHIMFGGFDAWLLSAVGGLDSEVNGTTGGWRDIIVRVAPAAVAMLGQGSVTHTCRFGLVALEWEYTDAKLKMDVSIPVGSRAAVHAPNRVAGQRLSAVREGERVLWSARGAPLDAGPDAFSAEEVSGATVVRVGSGTYTFIAEYEIVV